MVSPRMKFVLITFDEILLVAVLIYVVGAFIPELFIPLIVLGSVGSILYVIAKYYILYPSLLNDTYMDYDVVGMVGVVKETVTPSHGKVRLGQELWAARGEVGEIPAGAKVQIISREKMILTVSPVELE